MKETELYSTNRNNIQSSDTNGSADCRPIRHQSKIGQWLCWLASQQSATSNHDRRADQPVTNRSDVPTRKFAHPNTRCRVRNPSYQERYSDTVPRTLPGIRERTMVAGGSIEWESTEDSETTSQDHPTDAGTEHPEPSPEPIPDFPLAQPSSLHEEDRSSEGTNLPDLSQQSWANWNIWFH